MDATYIFDAAIPGSGCFWHIVSGEGKVLVQGLRFHRAVAA